MVERLDNNHGNAFIDNLIEVDRLSSIHRQVTSSGPGRKYDVQVLHKSAIVLLVSCWEAYIEDLARELLIHMTAEADDPKVFPNNVLKIAASINSGMNSWKLAGEGWKQVLHGNLDRVLAKTTGSLNTPKTAQTNKLFLETVGLQDIASNWLWQGRKAEDAQKQLDRLVSLRGDIAHRVTTSSSVTLKNVRSARGLINRIAVKSHNAACAHLERQIGSSPWVRMRFQGTY